MRGWQMDEAIGSLLEKERFPRAGRYEPAWILDGNMGPNPLWLLEWLSGDLALTPGMRVLDLGCGKALTSIFLAREFDVQVYALDLWTPADDNWERIRAAGETRRVVPLHGEAHALPFASGFFDAVVSIDAYPYFGTDELYLHYLSRFVRQGGAIGAAMPGLVQPFPGGVVPEHLRAAQQNGKVFWEDECIVFHTADWWRQLYGRCSRVDVVLADTLPDGWRLWRDHDLAADQAGKSPFPSDAETLERDAGRFLGFVRVVARRNAGAGFNLYDPALVAKVGTGS
jgi:SAM-dependent methyltransferase